jgi:hypothetical protein
MLKDSVWFLPSDQHRDAEAWLIARVKTDRHTECPTNQLHFSQSAPIVRDAAVSKGRRCYKLDGMEPVQMRAGRGRGFS